MTGWPSLCGALGLVAILFGLLSFVLGLFGAATDFSWIVAHFVVGVVLVVAWAILSAGNLRERIRSGEGRRIGKYGSSAVAQTLLGIAILGALAFLAVRHPLRWDWSEAKLHSLSDQTEKVLRGLDRDVEVVGFFAPLDTPPVRELLDRYAYVTDRFHFSLYDPNARPDVLERYGIDARKLSRGLLHVMLGDDSVDVTEATEEKITNALVQLSRTSQKKVYFLEGHNERPVQGDGAADATGFSRAAEALRDENYGFDTLLLAATGDVPEDADVVVLAGPTRPLSPAEEGALQRYLERGGSLLVLLDPRAQTNVANWLAGWGVEVGNDAVVDRVQGLFGQAMSPFARHYGTHPITKGLREVTLFHVVRSVRPREDAKSRFTELVRTSENSWGETDLDVLFKRGVAELGPDDLRGPVPIAVAGTPQLDSGDSSEKAEDAPAKDSQNEPRLVVFGDSDFASNRLIESYRNRDLFVNAVNWLLGDVEAISIRPRHSRASRIELSSEQFSQIRYLCLFVLPEAIAFAGVLAWWFRRRAPGR